MISERTRKMAVIGIFILLGISLVWIVSLNYKDDKNNDPLIDDDEGTELLVSNDHSIFRGCSEEEALEKIRGVFGNPKIVETIVIINYPFEKQVQYVCDDNISISMSTIFHMDEEVSYSFWIDMNINENDEIRFGPEHAMNVSAEFMDSFLEEVGYKDSNGYSMEVSRDESNWQSWNVNINPTFQNAPMKGSSVEIKVDYFSGKIRLINIWDWIYAYEVNEMNFSWLDANTNVIESLDKLNYTMEFQVSVEPEPNHSVGWSEYKSIEIEPDDLNFGGFHSVNGRLCIATILEVEAEGSFSIPFSSPLFEETRIIYYNGSVNETNTWFFDVETGKLLKWTLWNEFGGTSHDFFENYESGNSTWYDHVTQYEDYFPL